MLIYMYHVHGCMRSVLFDVFCSFTSYQNNIIPLYMASENGHHDVLQTLLGAGADVNIASSDVSHVMFYNYIVHSWTYMKTITCKIAHKPYN